MSTNYTNSANKSRASFTLIELLVTLAIVAVLSVVVIVTLNPAELLKQARDSNRLSDLATINTALNLFSTDVTSGFMGTSTVVYVSLPSTTSTCSNLGLPTLPTGYTYNCVTSQNLRNTDGSGWIPVNFNRISSNSPISQLPIDPTNTTSTGSYYTYVTGGSWMLSSIPESQKQKLELSNNPHLSKYPGVIGIGNNLDISPLYNSTGLVGYWKFDESAGGSVLDSSGNNNLGTWNGGSNHWTVGKIGGAGFFNGTTDYVDIPDSALLEFTDELTLSLWVKTSAVAIYYGLVTKYNCVAGPTCYGYDLGEYNNKGILAVRSGVSWNSGGDTSSIINDGNWHLLTSTFKKSVAIVSYIDGIPGTSVVWGSSSATSTAAFQIGARGSTSLFSGLIDDVRAYNRALSAAEVLALYNATK